MITLADYERRARWQATCVTWVQKYVALVRQQHAGTDGSQRAVIEYDAARTAGQVLDSMLELVELVEEDELLELEQTARELHVRLRRRRLAAALTNTQGRTDAEREVFTRKAAELRR